MAHNYDVGTRAWQPDAAEGWVASEVESKEIQGDKVKLVFRLENDEVPTLGDLPCGYRNQTYLCFTGESGGNNFSYVTGQ